MIVTPKTLKLIYSTTSNMRGETPARKPSKTPHNLSYTFKSPKRWTLNPLYSPFRKLSGPPAGTLKPAKPQTLNTEIPDQTPIHI